MHEKRNDASQIMPISVVREIKRAGTKDRKKRGKEEKKTEGERRGESEIAQEPALI